MKKLLLLSISAMMSLGAMAQVSEPTLTEDWNVTTGLPANTAARWAVGYDGKLYLENNASSKVTVLDGQTMTDIETGVNGWCLTVDEAGNLIISAGKFGTGSVDFRILPAGKTSASDMITLSVVNPTGTNVNGRMDTFGRAIGDVMSEKGGAFYVLSQYQSKIIKVFVANGQQVAEKTVAIEPGLSKAISSSNLAVVQPINNDIEATDNVVWMARSVMNAITKLDGTTYKDYATQKDGTANTTAGFDIITLGGVVYTIEPAGTTDSNGFIIVDRTNDKVVYTKEETGLVGGSYYATYVGFEKISDTKANVYHYAGGLNATKYTFEVPEAEIEDDPTAIESVEVAAGAVEYYNLQGVKVANPENGLFIKKQGNKVSKVVL